LTPRFDARVYARDNLDPHRREPGQADELVVRPGDRVRLATQPFLPLMVAALPADAARERVLAEAGATRPRRDGLDWRAIQDVVSRSGGVIDGPGKAGGWPRLDSRPALPDAEGDGMPDAWELGHGSDPQAFDAWDDANGNGWPNLEDYLNERAQSPTPATNPPTGEASPPSHHS
jgi:pectate lyase